MKHQSKENRASIVLFLLFLCFVTPRAKSQVLLENDSSDVCKVIDIVNVGLSTEIQKKYEKEYIATSVIVGYNLRKNEDVYCHDISLFRVNYLRTKVNNQ